MKLSTTGSKHDEAGCMMIIVWVISSGIIINCINKFNIFIKIFGWIFCFLLLIVGIYLVAKEYPKGETMKDAYMRYECFNCGKGFEVPEDGCPHCHSTDYLDKR